MINGVDNVNKYKYLVFDLDNTLVDNNESIKYAFIKVLGKLNIDYTEDLLNKWYIADMEWWHKYEVGESVIPDNIGRDEVISYLMAQRFVLFFEGKHLTYDEAVSINAYYIEMLANHVVPMEGALSLLEELSKKYKIIVATNGPREQAINKIAKANLSSYVNLVVSVEDTVIPKPKVEFMEYIYNEIKCFDKSKVLIIGDSLKVDVLWGMNCEMDTCWFNYKDDVCSREYKPTVVINSLLDLLDYLR